MAPVTKITYQCQHCNYWFDTLQLLTSHRQSFHKGKKTALRRCNTCGVEHSGHQAFWSHVNTTQHHSREVAFAGAVQIPIRTMQVTKESTLALRPKHKAKPAARTRPAQENPGPAIERLGARARTTPAAPRRRRTTTDNRISPSTQQMEADDILLNEDTLTDPLNLQ